MKKIPAIPVLCLAVTTVILAVLLGTKDDFIINHGIRSYNTARMAVAVAIAACAAWAVVAARLKAKAEDARLRAEHQERLDKMGVAKKPMDEDARQKLYRELEGFYDGKWHSMAGIKSLLAQLDSMNEYQAEMAPVLDQNGYLKQKPAEIVQQVEDCMYLNIKKLLNYMRVIQTRDPRVMAEKIADCEAKNADLLKKTDDFVVSVIDYVNRDIAPGEEEKTRGKVDEYMYVVLQAIELPETYLK